MRTRGIRLLLVASAAVPPLAGQEVSLQRGLALERRGSWQAAAEVYQELLRSTPADVNGLLGLERSLQQLGRPEAMTGPVTAALAASPRAPALYAVAVRAWSAAGTPDSVRLLVERWAELEPRSEAPYREWGFAAMAARDRVAARAAYRRGRERLGRPDALAGELAQLATLEGDYPAAITEWLQAIRQVPGSRASALSLLSQAPAGAHGQVLLELERRADPLATQLAAGLAARWGDPLRGIELLRRALPGGPEAVGALEEFLAEVRQQGPEAARARAQVLELLAERAGRDGPRWLAEAARAYADAGDQSGARRALGRLARDPAASPDVAASAAATLVGVLIAEGKLEEADRRLTETGSTVSEEERARLRHQLAHGWLRSGALDRAERLLAADSTVEGLALIGRLKLFRGDLRGATEALVAGGPYGGDRADVTEGAGLLAILQVVPEDSLPTLGAAFLALARGDSSSAAGGFEEVGQRLPAETGGAELALLAGRIRGRLGAVTDAERLYRRAAELGAPAPAAVARLELGELLARQGRTAEALALLERLILDYPESSVAPQARRLFDAIRGGAPPP